MKKAKILYFQNNYLCPEFKHDLCPPTTHEQRLPCVSYYIITSFISTSLITCKPFTALLINHSLLSGLLINILLQLKYIYLVVRRLTESSIIASFLLKFLFSHLISVPTVKRLILSQNEFWNNDIFTEKKKMKNFALQENNISDW